MSQTIPDGTLCLIIDAQPSEAHWLGTTVAVTFSHIDTLIHRAEYYEIGEGKIARRDCLLPIPPKSDDKETINTEKPVTVAA